jgi:DNA adenine methylase
MLKTKPFLKWVGGKTQLLEYIVNLFPKKMKNYHELFLGGGSVLLSVLDMIDDKKIQMEGSIYAYDLNKGLINTYIQIQKKPDKVIENLLKLCEDFKKIEINTNKQRGKPKNISELSKLETREHYYYWIRELYNKTDRSTIDSACYFIFLNKTCFRGMYREGSDGNFNIPYGLKDKQMIPSIFSSELIKNVSKKIKDVIFCHKHFKDTVNNIKTGDFVYMDPPYYPEKENSFVGYTTNGFDIKTHLFLFETLTLFDNSSINFVMSNSNTSIVIEACQKYNKKTVIAKRLINSKKPSSKTKEIIVWNYMLNL